MGKKKVATKSVKKKAQKVTRVQVLEGRLRDFRTLLGDIVRGGAWNDELVVRAEALLAVKDGTEG